MKTSKLMTAMIFLGLAQSSFAAYSGAYGTGYKNNGVAQINDAYSLLQFQNKMANTTEKNRETLIAQSLRLQSIFNFARTTAIKASINSNLNQFDEIIKTNERELDAIYNFQALMIGDRVVPPVITEARNLYNQLGKDQIRLSSAIYNIDQQAYFSSTPPNWRSYLNFKNEQSAFEAYTYLGGDLAPKNSAEREVWEQATYEGWAVGQQEANKIIAQSMQRLNKDYIGMIRFHELETQGRITMPIVNQYDLYDSNSGDRMVLNEQLLKINVLPQFTNPKQKKRIAINADDNQNFQEHDIDMSYSMPALKDKPTDAVVEIVKNVQAKKEILPSNQVKSVATSQVKSVVTPVTSVPVAINQKPTTMYLEPAIKVEKDQVGKKMLADNIARQERIAQEQNSSNYPNALSKTPVSTIDITSDVAIQTNPNTGVSSPVVQTTTVVNEYKPSEFALPPAK